MAKMSYSIPASLDRSFMDHEISLTGGGWGIRPMPIKQLLFFAAGIFVVIWSAMSTFINKAGPLLIVLFIAWGLITVFYFGAVTKTKELRVMTLPALFNYMPPTARKVLTRRSSNPSGFYSIARIDRIDDDGTIAFSDGGVGRIYLVVGSASYLLFDNDRRAILDRVDAFWRKVDTTCDWFFITTKESQRIYHQVANLERRNQALDVRDPDLIALQAEQYDILTGYVGGKFTSIHQYLVLKGINEDALRRGHMVVQSEVENSSLMIKEITMLDRAETQSVLRTLYCGVEKNTLAGGLA